MTRVLRLRALAACATLALAVGIVAASAQQEDLSPQPTRPPPTGPALNSPASPQAASPSQAAAGAGAVKPDLSQEFSDWLLRCYSKTNHACQISQRQVNPKSQALVIWVELTHTLTPKAWWQLVAMVPLGFKVPPDLGVRADGELILNMPIVTCLSTGCIYAAEMPVAGLETLRKTQTLGTEIVDLKGQRYAINISMRGFDQAYLRSAQVLKGK